MQVPGESSLESVPILPQPILQYMEPPQSPCPSSLWADEQHLRLLQTPLFSKDFFREYAKKGAGFSAAKLMGSTASYTLQRASYGLLLDAETLVIHKTKKSLKMKEPSPMIISKNKAKNEISFPGKKTWK